MPFDRKNGILTSCHLIPGLYAAAYDHKVEWMIVKGVASYGDASEQPSSDEWKSFASIMAASVAAKILNDPVIFQGWPHYNPSKFLNY